MADPLEAWVCHTRAGSRVPFMHLSAPGFVFVRRRSGVRPRVVGRDMDFDRDEEQDLYDRVTRSTGRTDERA